VCSSKQYSASRQNNGMSDAVPLEGRTIVHQEISTMKDDIVLAWNNDKTRVEDTSMVGPFETGKATQWERTSKQLANHKYYIETTKPRNELIKKLNREKKKRSGSEEL
jgi:hypothetical protein